MAEDPQDGRVTDVAAPWDRAHDACERFAALAERMARFDAMRDDVDRAYGEIEQRIDVMRQLAGRLDAIAHVKTPAVQAAWKQGQAETERQARELLRARKDLEHKRRRLVALVEAFEFALRELVGGMANAAPLCCGAGRWVAECRKKFDAVRRWLEKRSARWQAEPVEFSGDVAFEDALAYLPDLDGGGEQNLEDDQKED